VIFFLFAGVISSALFFVYLELQAPLSYARGESFVVTNEDSNETIASKLVEEGFIKNDWIFRIAVSFRVGKWETVPGGYELSKSMNAWEIAKALTQLTGVWVSIPEGLSKIEIAVRVGSELNWSRAEHERFVRTFAAIQWDRFNEDLVDIVALELAWSGTEKKAFTTMSAFFSDDEYDFLRDVYVPGDYLIPFDASQAQIADMFVSRFVRVNVSHLYGALQNTLHKNSMENVMELVRGSIELLPDLTPLPPADIGLQKRYGRDILVFTTTYWNQGKGPFELVGDPATRDETGDIDRNVFQRIYRIDGGYRDHLAGNFLWEQKHLHYHFSDFVDYTLELIDDKENSFETTRTKATFCIRDIDSIDTDIEGTLDSATYRICGKERQGISIGWGDSYFFTYVDQNIDVTNAPQGTYRLSFHVNPQNQFEEISINNNESSVLFDLSVAMGTALVIEEGS